MSVIEINIEQSVTEISVNNDSVIEIQIDSPQIAYSPLGWLTCDNDSITVDSDLITCDQTIYIQ